MKPAPCSRGPMWIFNCRFCRGKRKGIISRILGFPLPPIFIRKRPLTGCRPQRPAPPSLLRAQGRARPSVFFTRNLAADIKENLSKICDAKLMRRIEVVNLDRWVSGFLRKNDYTFEIDYGSRTKALWEKAVTLAPSSLGLPDSFFREEWEWVIQPQGITSFSDYIKALRVGRGVPLNPWFAAAI